MELSTTENHRYWLNGENFQNMITKIIQNDTFKTTLMFRLMVDMAFLTEGIQKFRYPAQRDSNRFETMGFHKPELSGNFVRIVEILAGLLILTGAPTNLILMTVAIVVTCIPIAFGQNFGPFVLRVLNSYGFWSVGHQVRTELVLWLASLSLFLKRAGRWSINFRLGELLFSISKIR
jgi:uncharacterized membrane protein YphA (DoxX/SURF4 family)